MFTVLDNVDLDTVAPLVGAWIEIDINIVSVSLIDVAPLVGAWIEIRTILSLKNRHFLSRLL